MFRPPSLTPYWKSKIWRHLIEKPTFEWSIITFPPLSPGWANTSINGQRSGYVRWDILHPDLWELLAPAIGNLTVYFRQILRYLTKVFDLGSGRTCGEIPNFVSGNECLRLWRNNRDSQSNLSSPQPVYFRQTIPDFLPKAAPGRLRKAGSSDGNTQPSLPPDQSRYLFLFRLFPESFPHPLNSQTDNENHCNHSPGIS